MEFKEELPYAQWWSVLAYTDGGLRTLIDDHLQFMEGGFKELTLRTTVSSNLGRTVLLPRKSHGQRSLVGCSPWGHYESDTTERLHFHTLKKEMATHSSVLAWRIPGMGEPGGLPSMGSHRVGHD